MSRHGSLRVNSLSLRTGGEIHCTILCFFGVLSTSGDTSLSLRFYSSIFQCSRKAPSFLVYIFRCSLKRKDAFLVKQSIQRFKILQF